MAVKTIPPDQRQGSLILFELTNLGTTRRKIDIPSGTGAITLYLRDKGSTSLGEVWVAVNAGTDTEATALLSAAGSRIPLFPGDRITIPAVSPITRLDFLASAAETGAHKLVVYATIAAEV